MEKMSIEMPTVSKCSVEGCGYNNGGACHAKAITVGDYENPGCDTFLDSKVHAKNKKRIAGVGACKVSACKHNQDFECTANNISVGFNGGKINCLTFAPKG